MFLHTRFQNDERRCQDLEVVNSHFMLLMIYIMDEDGKEY